MEVAPRGARSGAGRRGIDARTSSSRPRPRAWLTARATSASRSRRIRREIVPGNPRAAWAAESIGRQLQHMTRLLDDLLDISAHHAGQDSSLQRETVSLAEVVAHAMRDDATSAHRRARPPPRVGRGVLRCLDHPARRPRAPDAGRGQPHSTMPPSTSSLEAGSRSPSEQKDDVAISDRARQRGSASRPSRWRASFELFTQERGGARASARAASASAWRWSNGLVELQRRDGRGRLSSTRPASARRSSFACPSRTIETLGAQRPGPGAPRRPGQVALQHPRRGRQPRHRGGASARVLSMWDTPCDRCWTSAANFETRRSIRPRGRAARSGPAEDRRPRVGKAWRFRSAQGALALAAHLDVRLRGRSTRAAPKQQRAASTTTCTKPIDMDSLRACWRWARSARPPTLPARTDLGPVRSAGRVPMFSAWRMMYGATGAVCPSSWSSATLWEPGPGDGARHGAGRRRLPQRHGRHGRALSHLRTPRVPGHEGRRRHRRAGRGGDLLAGASAWGSAGTAASDGSCSSPAGAATSSPAPRKQIYGGHLRRRLCLPHDRATPPTRGDPARADRPSRPRPQRALAS